MSKVLRQSCRTLRSCPKPGQRSFITLPDFGAQSLTASRILPYQSTSLYALISDVESYSEFVPYCMESKAIKWSTPDKTGRRWPSEVDLKVGWGGYEEKFTSRVFCVPGSIVEALSGEAVTDIPKSDLAHHAETLESVSAPNDMFKSLSARWTLKPFHYKPPSGRPQTDKTEHPSRDQTEVHLMIDFNFANPVYAALSKAVAPKVAGMMIEAFEKRARKLLDGPASGVQNN